MSGTEQIEIERKYDVDEGAVVPDLVGTAAVPSAGSAGGGAGRPLEVARVALDPAASLAATYHDTADHRLLGARATLRRRTGGHDAGWHLKLPPAVAGGGRREVHHPLGAADEPVPAALRERVAALLGADGDVVAPGLQPVLLLETERTARHLLDGDGRELAEVADDVVRATRTADGRVRTWREWEVELGPGVDGPEGEALLDAVAPRLRAAGARASVHRSKLALGLGD
jgi:inorganic triphosphatase YgiF